jgi:hypothetical protein
MAGFQELCSRLAPPCVFSFLLLPDLAVTALCSRMARQWTFHLCIPRMLRLKDDLISWQHRASLVRTLIVKHRSNEDWGCVFLHQLRLVFISRAATRAQHKQNIENADSIVYPKLEEVVILREVTISEFGDWPRLFPAKWQSAESFESLEAFALVDYVFLTRYFIVRTIDGMAFLFEAWDTEP